MRPGKNTIYLIFGLLLFIYVLVRAVTVGVTFDEAWTITDFVPCSVSDIMSFNPPHANNHLFNTLAIKFFFFVFPENLFIARLPNVFAFAVYIYFSYKVCSGYFETKTGIMTFSLLLINPFLLDFFGLARGYGLTAGFTMGALYHLLELTRNKNTSGLICLLLFGVLAVLANFSALSFFFGGSYGSIFICSVLRGQK